MKTFPTLTPAQPGETAEQFGVRAFWFLAAERVPVGCSAPTRAPPRCTSASCS